MAAPDGTPWTGESIQGETDNAQRSQKESELPLGSWPKSKGPVSQNARILLPAADLWRFAPTAVLSFGIERCAGVAPWQVRGGAPARRRVLAPGGCDDLVAEGAHSPPNGD